MVGGRRPLPPKMGDRSDPPPSKIAHIDRFLPNKTQFFTGLRFEVVQASRGLSAIAELLVFSSPNLSSHRLYVYHTSTHGVAIVQIDNAGLKCAACSSLEMQDLKNPRSGHHHTTLSGYIFTTKARFNNRKETY